MDFPNVELHEADAVEWIRNYDGPAFDLIIEDLFVDEKKEPVRAVPATEDWYKTLLKHLSDDGALIMNHVATSEFKNSAYFTSSRIRDNFKSAFRITTPALDNIVAAFLRIETESALLRKNLMTVPEFKQALQNKKLCYRISKLNK